MVKKFTFKGKTLEELQKMDLKDFARLLTARERRSLNRGLTEQQKLLLKKVNRYKDSKKHIKTHVKDLIILPEMINASLLVHSGKDWTPVIISENMIGHYLGEFVLTRKKVAHSAPGIGATRSSAAQSK